MNENTPEKNHLVDSNYERQIEQHEPTNLSNFPVKIFSIIIQYMKWVASFRWYVIVLIVVVVLFVIFQLEHSIESRRQKKELKKEGMQNEQTKGIIKDPDSKVDISKKRVSFKDDNELLEYENMSGNDNSSTFNEIIMQVYNLWILPGVYTLSRNTGF